MKKTTKDLFIILLCLFIITTPIQDVYSEPKATPGDDNVCCFCWWHDDDDKSSCQKWFEADCKKKFTFKEGEGVGDKTKDCTSIRGILFTHGEQVQLGECFSDTVYACIRNSPSCGICELTHTGCQTFENKAKTDEWIAGLEKELKDLVESEKLPRGIKLLITANQAISVTDTTGKLCQQTPLTYDLKYDCSTITIYPPCNPAGKSCAALPDTQTSQSCKKPGTCGIIRQSCCGISVQNSKFLVGQWKDQIECTPSVCNSAGFGKSTVNSDDCKEIALNKATTNDAKYLKCVEKATDECEEVEGGLSEPVYETTLRTTFHNDPNGRYFTCDLFCLAIHECQVNK